MKNFFKKINELIKNISVTDRQEDKIESSFSNLKKHLESDSCSLSVKEVFLNGSYLRETIIRGDSDEMDIDVFAVIDRCDYEEDGKDPKPQSVLTKFKHYLEDLSDYKGKVHQDRPCVTIQLSHIHIDVLPAMKKNGQLFIPNEELSGWTSTDPKTQTENLKAANSDSGNKLVSVVKAIKHWKQEKNIQIPSFHVEEVAIKILRRFPYENLETGIRFWFDHAVIFIDKNNFGSDNKYDVAITAINEARQALNEANQYLIDEKDSEATKLWAKVFPKFPTITQDEARSFSESMRNGTLKYSAATGLSTLVGKTIAASGGFYGEK